ncbi:MAG TPA: hypothetical protein VFU53_10285 [Burkholderiales bacterium]|nr:hypothetical protein [Burkholderiales bacterium]
MKNLHLVFIVVCLTLGGVASAQQDKPGAVAVQSQEAVVTVRDVDRERRIVTVERPDGKLVTVNVPPQAQNLDQVHPGSKFRVSYLESVAVFISPTGGEAGAAAASVVELAEKGATPGGTIVNVRQVQARVDEIDHATRRVLLTGPEGNQVELTVDEAVQRLDEVKAGDIVVVRYTEALAMRMIQQ